MAVPTATCCASRPKPFHDARADAGGEILSAQGVLTGPYVGDLHVIAGLIILIREIAVSGLREFLGGIQVSVPVSKLAKWKTTAQMVAIAVLFLGTGLEHLEGIARQGMTPDQYAELVSQGLADPIRSCGTRGCSSYATMVGLGLIWVAGILTLMTGWDYYRKSLPFLREDK